MTLEKDLEIRKLREVLKDLHYWVAAEVEHKKECLSQSVECVCGKTKALRASDEILSTPNPPLSEQLKGVVTDLQSLSLDMGSAPPETLEDALHDREWAYGVIQKVRQTLSDLGLT